MHGLGAAVLRLTVHYHETIPDVRGGLAQSLVRDDCALLRPLSAVDRRYEA